MAGCWASIVAILALRLRNKTRPFLLSDLVASSTPIGLFFGRLANFINGELWGRVDRRALGHGLPARRPAAAPSQPALRGRLEGIVLFAVMLAGLAPRPTAGAGPAC